MSTQKITNEQTRQVEEFLRGRGFSDVECYQREGYNFLMRLRVTDPRFRGMNRVDRATLVEEELAKLPDELQASISMLVLVTPQERKTSLHSLEFDDPSRVLL
jgi:stress-induced morphogen